MSDRFNQIAQCLLYPKGLTRILIILGLIVLEIMCGFIVYITGGTSVAYLHCFYIPIILAGMVLRVPGGLIAGIAAGMIIGPYMPSDVLLHKSQPVASYIIRGIFFSFMGIFSGALSVVFRGYLENLHKHMTTDSLTHLPNTTGLKLIWQNQVQQNQGRYPGILVVTLNHLREIDKAFGSEATAEVLREVTNRLKDVLPESVGLAYVNYGTFAMSIPANSLSVEEICEKCRNGLGDRFLIGEIPIFLESHFGQATSRGGEETLYSMVRKAKIAVDKSIALNCQSASFDEKDDRQIQRNLKLSHDLSEAIDKDQLRLVYQPKVDLKSGECNGVEALVRWIHPELGMISPGEFIPMIEETLLINQFTRWLLKTALAHLQGWLRQGLDLTCALNFSMKNFEDPGIFTDLRSLLRRYEVPLKHLEIEVTETAIPANLDKVADILQSCREEGIKISVDDFGTGQSSMTYLLKLPVDCIKIDQTFVRSMMTNSAAEAIVRSAIILGHELNLEVIAEGVETEEERDKLRHLGCDGGQGFYFARPMPFEMATSWMQSRTAILKLG